MEEIKFEVFIVDDDKITILINRNIILRSHFHADPSTFLNGKDALDYILNNNVKDKTYCILLDINMPSMNGWQFLDAIYKNKIVARVFVVMVTSSVDLADKEKAGTYPNVIGFLEKPINVKLLEELKKHEALRIFFE